MILRTLLTATVAWVLAGCGGGWNVFVPSPATRFFARSGYQVYLPKAHDDDAEKRWPVILYLHGGGEAGLDNRKQTQVGLGPVLWEKRGELGFVVVMPQCPFKKAWPSPLCEKLAMDALDAAIQDFRGDPTRVTLMGNSMGGHGTLVLASRHPGRFSAIVPVAARVARNGWVPMDPEAKLTFKTADIHTELAGRIGPVPAWFFHGADDSVTPASESRKMSRALAALGGIVRYTEYAGAGHAASWERAYRSDALWRWLSSSSEERRGR